MAIYSELSVMKTTTSIY